MDDLTSELLEELHAFNPGWKDKYPSVGAAAKAAGVTDLYARWATTPDGAGYISNVHNIPDHVGESRRIAQAERQQPRSLPFGYDNLGWLPDSAWGGDGVPR